MKAVIYARVSTSDQETQNQIPVLTAWASQLRFSEAGQLIENLEVCQVYQESESAWHLGHQRELSRLMAEASRGQFKVVLVWALDRLTRQGIQAQFEIMAKLGRYGVLVYSYQEPWTLTPTKAEYDLLLAIAAYIAQASSKRNSERTKAGIERKRKSGWTPGRPPGSRDSHKRIRRKVRG